MALRPAATGGQGVAKGRGPSDRSLHRLDPSSRKTPRNVAELLRLSLRRSQRRVLDFDVVAHLTRGTHDSGCSPGPEGHGTLGRRLATGPEDGPGPGDPAAARCRPRWPARRRRLRRLAPRCAERPAGHDHPARGRLPDRVRDRDGGRAVRQRRQPGRPDRRDQRHLQQRRDAGPDPRRGRARRAADRPRQRAARPQPGHARRGCRDARPGHLDRPRASARVQRLPAHHQRERRPGRRPSPVSSSSPRP